VAGYLKQATGLQNVKMKIEPRHTSVTASSWQALRVLSPCVRYIASCYA